METQPTLRFDVEYPERLSRIMIFIKWLLAIPHYIILLLPAFAVAVSTLIAWFAILITGRFPASLFEFNLLVMRWGARVTGYVILLTDAYPPFGDGEHPVNLELDYPSRLSRLLIFVKWLLAIPHYIVLYFVGIIVEVLILISFFAILITARYPKGMFDFVVGYYRWSYRVQAYVGLMTDAYPPFGFGEPSATSGPPAEYVPPPQGVQPNF